MENQVFIPTEKEFKKILNETVDSLLARRIPQIIRQANRKTYLTTSDVKELTGMSSRMQKYHRDAGNLKYSQEGRRILYRTVDVERFIEERRVKTQI
ncbi:MAG: helix-turn-helix domain-containing protein [Balneolaceae bacterium]